MFYSEGEYYSINACVEYPPCNEKIYAFLKDVSANIKIYDLNCYSLPLSSFKHDQIMSDNKGYKIDEIDFSAVSSDCTIYRLDFIAYGIQFRLMFDYWNTAYYGASVVFSDELGVSESIIETMSSSFYRAFNPVYGNKGNERIILPLNELRENDTHLFKGEFVVNCILYEYIKDDLKDAQIKKLSDKPELFSVVGCDASTTDIIKSILARMGGDWNLV